MMCVILYIMTVKYVEVIKITVEILKKTLAEINSVCTSSRQTKNRKKISKNRKFKMAAVFGEGKFFENCQEYISERYP